MLSERVDVPQTRGRRVLAQRYVKRGHCLYVEETSHGSVGGRDSEEVIFDERCGDSQRCLWKSHKQSQDDGWRDAFVASTMDSARGRKVVRSEWRQVQRK